MNGTQLRFTLTSKVNLEQLHQEFAAAFGALFDGLQQAGEELLVCFGQLGTEHEVLDWTARAEQTLQKHTPKVSLAENIPLWETQLQVKTPELWEIEDLRKAVLIVAYKTGLWSSLAGDK